MAKTAKPNPVAIRYVQGELIDPPDWAIEREAQSRERYGVAQIERVQRGEEVPGDLEADRARLKALGFVINDAASAADMKYPAGSVVGNPKVDIRARDRIMGRAKYSSDTYFPGMLYVKALRSPHAHAKVKSIDTQAAAKLPGVAAIITWKDVPTGPAITRQALTDEPAFAGEAVAAVAASSEAIADDAINLIKVEWDKQPFVLDPQEALKATAPIVRSGIKTNAQRDPQFSYSRGDSAKGMADADVTAEVTVQTSYEQHVAMEPHNVVAVWDRELLTLYTGNQWPHGIANIMSAQLGIPAANVRVLAGDTGGGWGDKATPLPHHMMAAVLAKKTGKPVRYELNRKDVFLEAGHNYPLAATAKIGVKKDGTITALEGTTYITGGAYGIVANADDWENATRAYRVANVNVKGNAAYTNTTVTSPLRSVGEASGVFFSETLINRAAEAIDMDPLQFRLKNIENKIDQVSNLPYSSAALIESLQRGAELFNWQARWKGWKKGARDLSQPQKGIGLMCFACNKGANSPPMTAVVQIQGDGSIIINTGAADVGGGQRTTWAMIVAEAIGVPLENVKINAMDNQAGPDALGIFGTRGTKSVGTGMLYAAMDARRKLLEGVAFKWNLRDTEDIDVKDGKVFRKSDPNNKDFQLTIAQAAAAGVIIIDGRPVPASGTIVGEARVAAFSGYSQHTFGAGFYEVEVDPGTGYVKVTDVVQVHDIGRAINPMGLINQINGGIMHGINKALTEEMEYDGPTGVVVNANLDEYKLHMMDFMPPKIQIDYMEPYDVIGPFGAKGIGEPALLPAAASINAAIYDAVGVHIDYQPMTPYRILNAIKAKSA